MGDVTKVEWADATRNWWWGCTEISPGCAHCYAKPMAARFGVGWGPGVPRKMIAGAAEGLERLARKGDRTGIAPRVFMQSMSDLFEDREDLIEPRKVLWDLLHKFATERRRITPMILTKRPSLMAAWVKDHGWPENAWAGTTVEDQKRADERVRFLLEIGARVRFLSMEPLLGPVDLRNGTRNRWSVPTARDAQGHGIEWTDPGPEYIPVSWVIVGGESGAKARPMHPAWARSLRDQCVAAGVAFHFKQWGEWAPYRRDLMEVGSPIATRAGYAPASITVSDPVAGSLTMLRAGKHAAGRLLDGRTWDEVPQ